MRGLYEQVFFTFWMSFVHIEREKERERKREKFIRVRGFVKVEREYGKDFVIS